MPSQTNHSEIAPGMRLTGRALRFRYARSSGPGGQNVNKLNTKATLYVDLNALAEGLGSSAMSRLQQMAGRRMTDKSLIISSDEHRSQPANRRRCLEKLRALIVRSRQRPRPRKTTRPSAASIKRTQRGKQHRSRIKALRRRPQSDQ